MVVLATGKRFVWAQIFDLDYTIDLPQVSFVLILESIHFVLKFVNLSSRGEIAISLIWPGLACFTQGLTDTLLRISRLGLDAVILAVEMFLRIKP